MLKITELSVNYGRVRAVQALRWETVPRSHRGAIALLLR